MEIPVLSIMFVFILVLHLQIERCYGMSTTVGPTSIAASTTSNSASKPDLTDVSYTTSGNMTNTTYESHSTATLLNRTTSNSLQPTETHNTTGNTSMPYTFETSVSANANSSESHINWTTSSPISRATNITDYTNSTSSQSSLTTAVFLSTIGATRNDSNSSTIFSSNLTPTTVQKNITSTTKHFNDTPHKLNETETAGPNTTQLSTSPYLTMSVNGSSSTPLQNENASTVETTASFISESTTLNNRRQTGEKTTFQSTTNSSLLPNSAGSPKDAPTSGAVVFGAIIGCILGVVLIVLVGYFICGARKADAFNHRRLYEDIKNEPVLRLDDSVGPYDLAYGASSYHNPTVVGETEYHPVGNTLNFIPMDNLPSRNPSA